MISSQQDAQTQNKLYEELNEIVRRGSIPPPPSIEPPIMKRIANALLLELSTAVPELSKREREKLKLPPKVKFCVFFSWHLVKKF